MITLVLGGARSGKSEVAEAIVARALPPVTYVATMSVAAGADGAPADPDLAARVAAHRARRPSWWETVEVGAELPAVVAALAGTLLVDSLGPWVGATPGFGADGAALASALVGRPGDAVVVSEEVGLGVHPSSADGRRFRDALGAVNRVVAEVADDVLLVIAGRVLPLERP